MKTVTCHTKVRQHEQQPQYVRREKTHTKVNTQSVGEGSSATQHSQMDIQARGNIRR